MRPSWQLLRTLDPAETPDDDWAGDGDAPPLAACGVLDSSGGHGLPAWTGIEVMAIGFAADAQVARGANTCTLGLVEVASVAAVNYVGDLDATDTTDVPLGQRVYFPLNGSRRFAVRVTDNEAVAGLDELRILWRPVSR